MCVYARSWTGVNVNYFVCMWTWMFLCEYTIAEGGRLWCGGRAVDLWWWRVVLEQGRGRPIVGVWPRPWPALSQAQRGINLVIIQMRAGLVLYGGHHSVPLLSSRRKYTAEFSVAKQYVHNLTNTNKHIFVPSQSNILSEHELTFVCSYCNCFWQRKIKLHTTILQEPLLTESMLNNKKNLYIFRLATVGVRKHWRKLCIQS